MNRELIQKVFNLKLDKAEEFFNENIGNARKESTIRSYDKSGKPWLAKILRHNIWPRDAEMSKSEWSKTRAGIRYHAAKKGLTYIDMLRTETIDIRQEKHVLERLEQLHDILIKKFPKNTENRFEMPDTHNRPSGKKSKKHTLREARYISANWHADIWQASNRPRTTDRRLELSVLALCGCRPEELANGIVVRAITSDSIYFKIDGVKLEPPTPTKPGKGQPERSFIIEQISTSIEGQYLINYLFQNHGKEQTTIRTYSAKRLNDYIRRCGEAAFGKGVLGKNGEPISFSPYMYRHDFASRLKAQGLQKSEIAKALGHQSTESMKRYGKTFFKTQGGGRAHSIKATYEPRGDWSKNLDKLRGANKARDALKPDCGR